MNLNKRRAKFVYDGTRLAAIAAMAPVIPAPYEEREQEFLDQFEAVIEKQCGPDRMMNLEEIHNTWWQRYIDMGWVYGETYDPEAKTHPDMVPYWELGQEERDKDEVWATFCDIARQFIN